MWQGEPRVDADSTKGKIVQEDSIRGDEEEVVHTSGKFDPWFGVGELLEKVGSR